MTEKKGLLIGYLTDGTLRASWVNRIYSELPNGIPSGINWNIVGVKGTDYVKNEEGWAKARTAIVNMALERDTEWLCFIDSDVYPLVDSITRLMSHNKPIVTGIYYMKSMPAQPVIFKNMGSGPYWDYPVEELFPIEGSGLGICLIKTEVFEKFKENGVDFFKENWKYTNEKGATVNVKIGEDHWFFRQAKKLGFQPYCDGSVICDHVDMNTLTIFPGEEEIAKIRRKILTKRGMTDLLEKEDELYSLDKNKKTIVFYNGIDVSFTGDSIKEQAVGGTETAIINISKHLAKYFNVVVFCKCPKPGVYDGVYDGVHYVHTSETEYMKKFKTDLLVIIRNTVLLNEVPLREMFKIDKIALWMHDVCDSPSFEHYLQIQDKIDYTIAVSDWHKEHILKEFPSVEREKVIVLKNGIDPKLFNYDGTPKKNKLIYSSTPYRGLDILLDVFPEIKEQVPDAELYVYSSLLLYGHYGEKEDHKFKHLYDQAKRTDGVVYKGSVTQSELAESIKNTKVMAYPSTYPETSCIGIMENISSGSVVVASNLAAIPETMPEGCGVLLPAPATSIQFKKDFVKAVVELLKNDDKLKELQKNCKGHDFSWKSRSNDWINAFFPNGEERKKSIERAMSNALIKQGEYSAFDLDEEKEKKDNINTPEYWDRQYKYEEKEGIDQRTDKERYEIILKGMEDGRRVKKVLDFGCARGEFLSYLEKKEPDLVLAGVDISEYALGLTEKYVDKEVKTATSIKDIKEKAGLFDVITAQHVIEHVDNPIELIEELRDCLRPQGILILAIPINDDEWIEHQKIYKLEDVRELLNEFGCMYKILHRKETKRKKNNGEYVEEAIAFVKFN